GAGGQRALCLTASRGPILRRQGGSVNGTGGIRRALNHRATSSRGAASLALDTAGSHAAISPPKSTGRYATPVLGGVGGVGTAGSDGRYVASPRSRRGIASPRVLEAKMIHATRGGAGQGLLVLLHGLGANGSVWDRVIPLIASSWRGRWLVPDLRGHGRSIHDGPYGFGTHASDVADLMVREQPATVTVAGHAFGGVVAALVAFGWFGVRVDDVAAFGVKIEWTTEETRKAQEMAGRPVRVFATRDEAIDRSLRLSGLIGL